MATLAPTSRLRGREVQLQALGEALDRVASGHPAVVLVEGEAGIGKSRLLAEALDDAQARGLHTVAGRAQELERNRPFGVLADTLACAGSSPDPRRRAIAGLLAANLGDRGPLTVSSDPGLQFQAVDAFADLVEALALDRPLVIGLDDLQWADPSSLLTLGVLTRRLGDVPVGAWLAACGCSRVPRSCSGRWRCWTRPGRGAWPWGSWARRPWLGWSPRSWPPSRVRGCWPGWPGRAATRCLSPSWWGRCWRREPSRSRAGGPRWPR
jgi:predicted ATPase